MQETLPFEHYELVVWILLEVIFVFYFWTIYIKQTKEKTTKTEKTQKVPPVNTDLRFEPTSKVVSLDLQTWNKPAVLSTALSEIMLRANAILLKAFY